MGTGEGSGPKCCPGPVALAGMEVPSGPLQAQGDWEAEMQMRALPSSGPASPRSSCRRQSCHAELPHRRRCREGEQVQGLNHELLLSLLPQQILAGPCQAPGTHRKVSALPFEGCHEGRRRKSRSLKIVPFLQTGGWSTVLVHLGLSHWLGAPQGELCRDRDLRAGSSCRSWPEEGRRGMLGAGRGVQARGGRRQGVSTEGGKMR